MVFLQAEKLHPSLHPVMPLLGFNGNYLVMLNLDLHCSSRKTTQAEKRCFAVFSGLPSPEEKQRHQRIITSICGQSGQHSSLLVCLLKITQIRTYILKMALTFPFSFCSQTLVFMPTNHLMSGYLAYLIF